MVSSGIGFKGGRSLAPAGRIDHLTHKVHHLGRRTPNVFFLDLLNQVFNWCSSPSLASRATLSANPWSCLSLNLRRSPAVRNDSTGRVSLRSLFVLSGDRSRSIWSGFGTIEAVARSCQVHLRQESSPLAFDRRTLEHRSHRGSSSAAMLISG